MAPSKAGKARELAKHGREEYAREALDADNGYKAVFDKIRELAGQGFEAWHVQQKRLVDMHGTNAAAELEKLLSKAGYRVTWERATVPSTHDLNPTGLDIGYQLMVISWQPQRGGTSPSMLGFYASIVE